MQRRRPSEDDKEDMRRLRAKGATVTAIGERLGFSKSAVHRAVADMEVDGRIVANRERAATPPKWLPKARRMLRKGKSRYEIASALNIPISTLYRTVEKFSA